MARKTETGSHRECAPALTYRTNKVVLHSTMATNMPMAMINSVSSSSLELPDAARGVLVLVPLPVAFAPGGLQRN